MIAGGPCFLKFLVALYSFRLLGAYGSMEIVESISSWGVLLLEIAQSPCSLKFLEALYSSILLGAYCSLR